MDNQERPGFTPEGCSSLKDLFLGATSGGVIGLVLAAAVADNPTIIHYLLGFFCGDAVGGSLVLLAKGLDYRLGSKKGKDY